MILPFENTCTTDISNYNLNVSRLKVCPLLILSYKNYPHALIICGFISKRIKNHGFLSIESDYYPEMIEF